MIGWGSEHVTFPVPRTSTIPSELKRELSSSHANDLALDVLLGDGEKLGSVFSRTSRGMGRLGAIAIAVMACNPKTAAGAKGCQDLSDALNAFAAACGGQPDARFVDECQNLEAAPGVPTGHLQVR